MLELGILIVSIVGNLILADLAYRANSKSRTNQFFIALVIITILWLLANYVAFHAVSNAMELIAARIVMALAAAQIMSLYFFIQTFPSEKLTMNRIFYRSSVLYAVIVMAAALSPYLFVSIKDLNPTPGPAIPLFMLLVLVYFIGGIISVIRKTLRASGILRRQLIYLSVAIILAFTLIALSNFILVIFFNNTHFLIFTPVYTLILVGVVTYAIEVHHLFDIRVLLTQVATAFVILALFIQTLISRNVNEWLINGSILIIVSYGGYLIIKSVIQEIKRRQQIQKLANELEIANKHLKELDQLKTEFVSLASHELLTPVSAIEGYLSMLLDEKLAKITDPKAQRFMDRVYTAAKRLARLITDMLNVSRIEEGRLLVEKKEVNLLEIIPQVIDELKFKAQERKQKIIFRGQVTGDREQGKPTPSNLQPATSFQTLGDSDKIKQVLVNLIGNAIKFSPNPGQITISLEKSPTEKVQETWQKIEEKVKTQGLAQQEAIRSIVDENYRKLVGQEQILVKVQDQGVGIPPEELPKLFKKFQRLGDYTTSETQGTGLGLYISRGLVELHHGRIWAKSEGENKGSTFTFSLPQLSAKSEILNLEKQIPQKGDLKPLARPAKTAEEL